jgi:outer membrane receptor protein involved in Fe transport
MPRISFTFPIAEQSMFYAHYDVLVQRPKSAAEIYASPLDYYYLSQNAQDIIQNPDLKPERVYDYELGFQQVVSQNSAITITGFYKERKDMIQVRPYLFAWPNTYFTYGNRDFSTTKGFVLRYDLRRINHLMLNLSYTLQFAEGTGSSSSSSNAGGVANGYNSNGLLGYLIGARNPNLRFAFPLEYDSRHNLVANLDYRYDEGEGPVVGGSRILQNAGANLIFRTRSGEPYTRREFANQRIVAGGVQSSRLPWHYMLDLRVDKNFDLSFRKAEEGVKRNSRLGLTAFVYISNLLNTRDVLGVYGYTSRPDDDGFLVSPQGMADANAKTDAQSWRDLYSIDKQEPTFLNNPRRINLGLSLNF